MSAPSSIRDWLKSPDPVLRQHLPDDLPEFLFTAVSSMLRASFIRRAATRSTLPSTAGTRISKAMEAMAPAEYSPQAGQAAQCRKIGGQLAVMFLHQLDGGFLRFRARL